MGDGVEFAEALSYRRAPLPGWIFDGNYEWAKAAPIRRRLR
jgi:hypothetical protein